MLQYHSQQTNEISLFFKDFFYLLNFFTFSIPSDGDQIILILYCFKKACERERIHLMSKRRLR